METEVVSVLSVPVKVVSFGGVTPTTITKNPASKPKELILVVTGNPGVTRFYLRFAERLNKKTKLPVWLVSHGGHERLSTPTLSGHEDLYTLEGQTRQKKELITTYLQGVKLRCVGHSIGSKILLDLLKDSSTEKQMESCHLLFPTIERMVITGNGEFVMFVHKFLLWLIIAGCAVLNFIPNNVRWTALRIYCFFHSVSPDSIPAIADFLEGRILRQVFFLAKDEMLKVLDRDDETIKKNVNRIKFYYGATDGWTPPEYVADLRKTIPDADVEVDQNGFPHSFVLNYQEPMADIVAGWINNSSGDSRRQ